MFIQCLNTSPSSAGFLLIVCAAKPQTKPKERKCVSLAVSVFVSGMLGVQVCGHDLRPPPAVPSVIIRLQMVMLIFITSEAGGSWLRHQRTACWGAAAWFDYESPQDIFTIHRLLIKPRGECCVASGGGLFWCVLVCLHIFNCLS